ncbi:oxidoreductase C-terminal domain-containing protein [Streptomyces sp. NPDC059909]|uniref:oxidoreductase C-terminal domain-containing protein n=1 Tax=Streptomyces sp. NPDC059909 TaxID=3346998 RepID=UPI0036650F3D
MAAAGNLLGDANPFAPVPYFWTDQYDTKIQAYGIFPPDAAVRIVHGDPQDGHFAAAYGHHGRVVGVLGWNTPPPRTHDCAAWSPNARRGQPSRPHPRSARQQ